MDLANIDKYWIDEDNNEDDIKSCVWIESSWWKDSASIWTKQMGGGMYKAITISFETRDEER